MLSKFRNIGRTRHGVIWSFIERFSTQIVQFGISIILARLLTPADFGIIAIINIFLVLFQTINETGFGAALMQKLDRDELDFSSVFVFNIALGTILYSILFIGAPLIALFFKNDQLVLLTRVVGINLIISSFVVVQRAKLMIKIDFKTQAKAAVVAAVVSGVLGVYLAYSEYGVMALVAYSICNTLINTVLIWVFARWSPSLKFSFKRFKRLFNFAYKLTLARIISVTYDQIAPVLIGKFLTPSVLGYYNRAYSFQALPSSNIVGILQRVSAPLLYEQQNDVVMLRETLKKFIVKASSWVFPLMVGIAVLSKPMIIVLLTDKWAPSIIMLQLICPIGALYVLNSFNLNIFNALNRTDLALRLEIIKKTISICLLIIAIRYGIIILLVSQIIVSIIELLFNTYYTKRLINFGLIEQLKSVFGVIIASLIMGFSIFVVIRFVDSNLGKLIVGGCIGGVSYLLITWRLRISLF